MKPRDKIQVWIELCIELCRLSIAPSEATGPLCSPVLTCAAMLMNLGLQAVYGAITDNWPTVEPYFNETGSNCPSILPMKQQQELIELAVQAVQCLGFQMVSQGLTWQVTTIGMNALSLVLG